MHVVAMIHEENGVYGVSFPDFPGCVTGADDLDSAVAKAAEVLAFHVEGLAEDGPLPQVRSLAQLANDPHFREDSEGAALVLVPYAPPAAAVRVNITVDESLLKRIDRAAEAAGETRSYYLAEAAKRRLGGDARSDAPAGVDLAIAERRGRFNDLSTPRPSRTRPKPVRKRR